MASLANDERNRLIRAIHAGARERGIDSEARKSLQNRLVGKHSCADMTVAELRIVAKSMQSTAKTKLPAKSPKKPAAERKDHRLIYALWWDLGNKGGLGKGWRSLSGDDRRKMLNGFVRKMTFVDRLEWTTPDQAKDVAEALKARIKRLKRYGGKNVL